MHTIRNAPFPTPTNYTVVKLHSPTNLSNLLVRKGLMNGNASRMEGCIEVFSNAASMLTVTRGLTSDRTDRVPDNFVFKLRRGPSNVWASKNTILGAGEPGIEMDTGWFKIGDGITPWNDLPYFVDQNSIGGGASDPALAAHVLSETPHPVYDDGPSLVLLYENAKV